MEPAAEVAPSASDDGEHGDGADGRAAALASLDTVVEPDDGWLRFAVGAGESDDVGGGDAGPGRDFVGGVGFGGFAEVGPAVGVSGQVFFVGLAVSKKQMHQAEGEG